MKMDVLYCGLAFILYLTATTSAVPTQRGCGGKPADIVFLLDSSSSIWPPNFRKQIVFVREVVEQFDVRRENTRVSVLTFSNRVHEDFSLLTHGNHLSTLRAIDDVQQRMGDTRTDMALLRAREILTSEGRVEVPRLVVVLTDGLSDFPEQTREEAKLTREAGVSVFAIGIGDSADREELEDIASSSDYVFSVDTFDALNTLKTLLAVKACEAEVLQSTTSESEGLKVNGLADAALQGDQAFMDNRIHDDQGLRQDPDLWNVVGQGHDINDDNVNQPTTVSPMAKGCDGKPAEIVFALDESGSIWEPDFRKQLSFVQDMVGIFNISPQMTRIGLLTFGDHPRKAFHLDKYGSEEDVKEAISNIHQMRGDTNTAETLHSIRKHFFAPEHVRDGVVQIAVVITDGQSMDTEATAHQAQLAREAGIHLFAVGVGQLVDKEELHKIASHPTDQYTFTVDNYDALLELKKLLAMKTCQVTLPPTTTTTTTPTTTTVPPGCGAHRPADIMFAMPSSADRRQAKNVLRMLSELAERAELGASAMRMGLVPKDCYKVPGFQLKETDTKEKIISKIEGGYAAAASRGTAETIKYMREKSFKKDSGAREGARRIAVIILDKEEREERMQGDAPASDSGERSEDQVESFKAQMEDGLKMVVIRVGNYSNYSKAKGIASKPADDNIFSVDNYDELPKLAGRLQEHFDDICNGLL